MIRHTDTPSTAIRAFAANTATITMVATLALASVGAVAEVEADQNNDLFVPDKLSYYNPLKHNKYENKSPRYETKSIALSNTDLEHAAQQIRANNMSSQQRALNHQWLEQQHNNDAPYMGGKVLSKLMQMGLRTYWDGVRNKHYSSLKAVPDSGGNGKVNDEVDYKIRLSGSKVKLSFEYEF